jgi:hypothetical protein
VLHLTSENTGAAAGGDGVGVRYQAENSAGTLADVASVDAVLDTVTAGSEVGALSLSVQQPGTGLTEVLSLEGAGARLTQAAQTSGAPVALTVTGAANTGVAAATEASDVVVNLARSVTWAAGAGPLALQRAFRVAAPTYVGNNGTPLTITTAATVYIDAAPTQGADITLTNTYALLVDAGRVRFDGAVVQNAIPVVQSTTDAAPAPTINTPAGVVTVANGATTVSVTCAACTATTLISGTIRNATTNNVTLRAIIPGASSFVVHLSGDPGASGAEVYVEIKQPGTGT